MTATSGDASDPGSRSPGARKWLEDTGTLTGILDVVSGAHRDGLAVLDPAGMIVHANGTFRELTAAARHGDHVDLRALVPPQDAKRVETLLEEAELYGHTASALTFQGADGHAHRLPVRLDRTRAGDADMTLLIAECPQEDDTRRDAGTRVREAKITTAILETARAAASAGDMQDLCQRTAEAFFDVYPAPIVVVHLLNKRGDALTLAAADGEARRWLGRPWNLPMDPESPSLLVQAAIQRRTIVQDRIEMVSRFAEFDPVPEGEVTPAEVQAAFARLGIRTVADVPIVFEDTLLGVIGMGSQSETVDEGVVGLLELLAHEIAAGLHRLNLEAARERLLESTRAAHQELAEFTYNVSHDLSEELRRVVTLTESLSSDYAGDVPGDAADLAERVHAIATRLQARVKGSLELAQVLRHDALDREMLALGAQVTEAVARITRAPRAEGTRFHVADDLPRVWADPAHLAIVLDHLLDNALAFNTGPERDVWVRAEESDAFVDVLVEDNGPGVPAEYRDRIFEAFRKNPAHERTAEAGLGLTLARKLAEWHGGALTVEDREPGPGARFRLRLPHRGTPNATRAWGPA